MSRSDLFMWSCEIQQNASCCTYFVLRMEVRHTELSLGGSFRSGEKKQADKSFETCPTGWRQFCTAETDADSRSTLGYEVPRRSQGQTYVHEISVHLMLMLLRAKRVQ